MTFVHLTSPAGTMVRIVKEQIVELREPMDHEMAQGTRTVIMLTNGNFRAVKEPPDVVEAKLG